ncbi:MAG: sugar ABC transporter permease [Anaerolineae bacterium]|jgi:ABC-type sugar transport system permease subunit|nr:sugar ABC transporter permease [Anaerolineae bacterium]
MAVATPRSTRHLERFLGGPWPFILPGVVLYLALSIYPLFYQFYLAMTDMQVTSLAGAQWIGLDNFAFLFSDSRFREALQFTFIFVLITVPLQYTIAFALALLVDQKLRGRIVFRLTYILPLAISSLIVGLMWRLLMHESAAGFINAFLERLGLGTLPFFSNPHWARFSVIFVNIWASVGSTMIFLLGGLQTIDPEQIEAATVDGANAWQRFFLIKLPLMREISSLALIFMFVATFGIFEKILALTFGGPANATFTIGFYMFVTAFGARGAAGATAGLLGRAAAMGVVMFFVIMVFVLLYLRMILFEREEA